MKRWHQRSLALGAGLVCHGSFAAAVASMAVGLGSGLQDGLGHVPASWRPLANGALVLQFPLLHSWLLTPAGRRWLARLLPGRAGRTLVPTTYAAVAALQLLSVFAGWTPSGAVWYRPAGVVAVLAYGAFAASWVLLLRAILDAGAGLQTGAAGWLALLRGGAPRYGPMPVGGLFRRCRQPIYLAFFLILWTAPTWSSDHLLLALAWSPYCVFAPRLKERRYLARHGEAFARYQRDVPYFVPYPWPGGQHENRRRR